MVVFSAEEKGSLSSVVGEKNKQISDRTTGKEMVKIKQNGSGSEKRVTHIAKLNEISKKRQKYYFKSKFLSFSSDVRNVGKTSSCDGWFFHL